eukprot:gene7655-8495_t
MESKLSIIIFGICALVHSYESIKLDKNFRLPKREGVQVGYFNHINLIPGIKRNDTLLTISMNPTIFEIPAYFSHEECEYLIMLAKNAELKQSPLHPNPVELPDITTEEVFHLWDVNKDNQLSALEFTYVKGKGDLYLSEEDMVTMFNKLNLDKDKSGTLSLNEFMDIDLSEVKSYLYKFAKENPAIRSRNSNQTWLWHYGAYNELLESFHERLSKLTLIPHDIIEMSEPMQIVQYNGEGHYHCHHDSDEVDDRPCCTFESQKLGKCRLCRYMTVLFFLSDVEEGGELVFQIADNATFSLEDWDKEAVDKCNTVMNCKKGNLVIKPKKGTALMWYNHDVDPKTGSSC